MIALKVRVDDEWKVIAGLKGDKGDIGEKGDKGDTGEIDVSLQTVTLLAANWTANAQSLTVPGVTATSTNFISIESFAEGNKWAAANIYATSQATNEITFECENTPTEDITFKVSILQDA
jgi:hypothetical protein